MAYNPKTATPAESWNFRMKLIKEQLEEIALTGAQRIMLQHHLNELAILFSGENPHDDPWPKQSELP